MERKEIWRLAFVLFLGQLVSLFLAVASFTSSFIAEHGVDTYLSLVLVYGLIFLYRRQKLLVPWYWYIALAIVDVQGNYLESDEVISIFESKKNKVYSTSSWDFLGVGLPSGSIKQGGIDLGSDVIIGSIDTGYSTESIQNGKHVNLKRASNFDLREQDEQGPLHALNLGSDVIIGSIDTEGDVVISIFESKMNKVYSTSSWDFLGVGLPSGSIKQGGIDLGSDVIIGSIETAGVTAMARNGIWRLLFVLFLGKLVTLCLSVASFTSSLIAELGVNTPLTQSFCTYLSLVLVYGPIFLYRRQKLLVPWYWYIGLAIVDVQGSYLVVKAYQYSSITSVALLGCWTIPWVIILTYFALGSRYSLWKLFGSAICVVGLSLVLLSDSGVSSGGGKRPLLGDGLVIAGTFFYGFSNVGEEFCVKKKDRIEALTMLGAFGVLVSASEIYIFERNDLKSVTWSPTVIFLFVGFALATFGFYTVVPFVLKMSGATVLNLSLLTSDMSAVLIHIFFYHQQVGWLYYVAFAVVAIGLITYSVNEAISSTTSANGEEEAIIQYEALDEENSSS